MTAPLADRFTAPHPTAPVSSAGTSDDAQGLPAGEHGLGAGMVLLLAGAAAASAWAAPAEALADPAPGVEPAPEIAAPSPVTPLWPSADALGSEPSARDASSGAPAGTADHSVALPDSAALPDAAAQPGSAAAPVAGTPRIENRLAQGTLTMRSGETLWSLTADLLGPHASPEEISRGWPRLWEANADQIRDPDRVLAGTVLQVPDSLLPEH